MSTPSDASGANAPAWQRLNPPSELAETFAAAPSVTIANSVDELVDLACGGPGSDRFTVSYDVPGKGNYDEVEVVRVRNGVAANYTESYMRRRDPDCMVIGDDGPTNKPRFDDRFGYPFADLRKDTFAWLKTQDLACFAFTAGREGMGMDALVVAPANAGFFALGLAMLQGIRPLDKLPKSFDPKALIYVAPTFRHTHFDGKQIVVHERSEGKHELFSYNLYPGPSAKKGVYGMLIGLGEREGWVTAHCSAVAVRTPYDKIVTFMHEGASGGGKSELLEQAHRDPQGRLTLGKNTVTGEVRYLEIPRLCALHPITDDMALCHTKLQEEQPDKRLRLTDAEDAWFVRVNHIDKYGTDIHLESLCAQPPEPLLFLSIDAKPGSRAMIWEHIEDAPGQPCPNPRVIIPRRAVPGVVDEPVHIDVRSFGVRTPPCTRQRPSYGIIGLFHLLPPALAWLWRLTAPRGHANPSIVETEGMSSEGVGSYWPFATGSHVAQANLLLDQFTNHSEMRFILCPNQYVGAWHTGFMPQWVAREYFARRGAAPFPVENLRKSRCPLLGWHLHQLNIEGRPIARWFLQVDSQPEVGEEAYDKGAAELTAFFEKCLREFLTPELSPLGREIITCFLDNGNVDEYLKLVPQPMGSSSFAALND